MLLHEAKIVSDSMRFINSLKHEYFQATTTCKHITKTQTTGMQDVVFIRYGRKFHDQLP